MAALSGALDGIQLAPLVRFLAELRKTGYLAISDDPWTGTIAFDQGRLVGAAFGAERGVEALDAIGLAMTRGAFVFSEADADAADAVELTLMMSPAEVQTHLAELARESAALGEVIPSMSASPRLVREADDDLAQVTLDRGALSLLLALEAGGTVADVAARRGVIRSLRQMAQLVRLGLVRVDDVAPAGQDSPMDEPDAPRGTNGHAVQAQTGQHRAYAVEATPKNDRWWRRA